MGSRFAVVRARHRLAPGLEPLVLSALAARTMSNSTIIEIPFNHGYDCLPDGCPGHVLRGQYHGTSDTWWYAIDGQYERTFGDGVLRALLMLFVAMADQRAEVEEDLRVAGLKRAQ